MNEGTESTRQARTVTLEVTARQAERVAVATRLGRLALIVRSATGTEADAPDAAARAALPPTITWGGDVSPALRSGAGAPGAAPRTLQIFQGAAKREEFKF
jgi:pilus assembly protein CpaB